MQDIKPLLVFAAVLEHGSMNAAAAALGMTPSAVSQHINRLESVHGIKLLNRSTRRLTPTDAGQTLGGYCRRLSRTLSDTHAAIGALKTEPAGDLHISLTSSVIDCPAFQTALMRLQNEFPRIRPVLHFNDALDDLHSSRFDLAIRGGDRALDDPGLVARHLTTWHFQICASPSYLARHPPITRPEQLRTHHWLYFGTPHITLHKNSESRLIDLSTGIHCNQIAAVRSLTVAGIGLSCQVSGEIGALLAQGRLQTVLPDWMLPAVNLYLVTPYRVQSAKTEAAVRIIQESFAQEAV
ncbi:LysR family transcriptional regulator [Neisseria animalis]|uniref:LysR family transcriptional regulator n=1 Tax=Neisseria animalis TaxID=492 RepID=A0A5P3MQ89_NEIAN|nr:LysR family transcriptional regulator [Neisseria animalis]QEY23752.1 LysR family transcriptional regulator [Neisseria animalis]ROW32894.1 LysR family transcriptional regulator [Neisseria animalis]VEE09625.1 LysR family transcriptional regulator [Neisseria animalis]